MKLRRVEISNYRSIKELTLRFEEGCQVLLGVNESGKTNILRALSLLSPEFTSSNNDLRIERKDEIQVTAGHVRFVFDLSSSQTQRIYDGVSKRFHSADIAQSIVTSDGNEMSLLEFCRLRSEGLYVIEISTGKKAASYWALPTGFTLCSGWLKIKDSTVVPNIVRKSDGSNIALASGDYFFQPDFEVVDATNCEIPKATDISTTVGAAVIQQIKENLLPCIMWRYTEANNLPSTLSADTFAADPNTCIPLRSMFELAGYRGPEIGKAILTARSQQPHRYIHLLEKVSGAATRHLRRVWKSQKGVQIQLKESGDQIRPIVIDEQVPLDYANRSDGFKRFVSFMLMISAKVETDGLANTLILVDEPEIALHPTGAKALMRELIEIGEKNYVVYSTHSIFMVDKENIPRHLIVEKKDEVTIAAPASKSRIQDEEVLYNAIGFSLFETLRPNNIIFEGWSDKQLYKAFLPSFIKGDAEKKAKFAQIGSTNAEGVKDVKNVSKFLELASRGCLILSDADRPAIEKRKQYLVEGGYGKWFLLSEVFGHGKFVTGEDFLTEASVLKRSKVVSNEVPALAPLTTADIPQSKPRAESLTAWLARAGLDEDKRDKAKVILKNALFEKLQRTEIVDDYEKVLEFINVYDFEV